MIASSASALLALAFISTVSSAEPGVIHVPVVRNEVPSGLQQTLRKRASSKYASVDLQNLQSIYSINISIAGQPTSVVLDTGKLIPRSHADSPTLAATTTLVTDVVWNIARTRWYVD